MAENIENPADDGARNSRRVREEVERLRTHLRAYVQMSGVSSDVLAERLDLTVSEVARLLAPGGSPPELYQVFVVLDAIGRTPRQLFSALYGTRASLRSCPQSIKRPGPPPNEKRDVP
jgi:hypothetical protein